jgi:hypothetical protein
MVNGPMDHKDLFNQWLGVETELKTRPITIDANKTVPTGFINIAPASMIPQAK